MKELIMCNFESDNKTTSSTKCKFCGKEKHEHEVNTLSKPFFNISNLDFSKYNLLSR